MFDLVRLAYVARHRREALGLNMRQLERITGVSKSQLSAMEHRKRICAGSTFMVMEALGIDPAEMLEADAAVRLERIRAVYRTQNASRGTHGETTTRGAERRSRERDQTRGEEGQEARRLEGPTGKQESPNGEQTRGAERRSCERDQTTGEEAA